MSYQIAIASSDEQMVDLTFGEAKVFRIYEVSGTSYHKIEDRVIQQENGIEGQSFKHCGGNEGCHGGGGCAGKEGAHLQVVQLLDCRCIVCKKIGFPVQKQLERHAIVSFDVSCAIEEALTKISRYYEKIDGHQSLRRVREEQ